MGELTGDRAAEVLIDTRVDTMGTPLITLSGELDSSNVESLESTIASITADRPERLIFDLSGLRFMDSAGISALIGAAAKVQAVQLRAPSPAVRRVIELTGLSDVLPIEP
ncbi:MAG TPA: STAS domain-containing protein [Solirubrobacteraceae bacterium]|nr:STAS domain-containing protein [Solirubrobacteraceae bacterium]